jgi:predicted small integral membrane protein
MSLSTSIWLFQAVNAGGLALWLAIAVINNLHAFAGSAGAVGATLAMAPLRQAPAIETPLLARAICSPAVARVALLVVLALQIVAAGACWIGACTLIVGGDLAAARPSLNIAMSGFAAFLLAMHLGGLWFGYWIRQEGLQLTHIGLLIWSVAAFCLFNLPFA